MSERVVTQARGPSHDNRLLNPFGRRATRTAVLLTRASVLLPVLAVGQSGMAYDPAWPARLPVLARMVLAPGFWFNGFYSGYREGVLGPSLDRVILTGTSFIFWLGICVSLVLLFSRLTLRAES